VHQIVERVRGSIPALLADPVLRRGCLLPPDLAAGLHLRPDLGVHHLHLLGGHPHQSTRHRRQNVSSRRRQKMRRNSSPSSFFLEL
jgi:hypothetical protein